ncbi:hypothetical protein HAX54_018685 [Datura stramonium]|uniref:DnaJ homologue subfamily C member 28 conserved domain-containing protein n=1 Tax=Datura stramonium TaxID=4076 RepID=A0ABS8UMW2_DATST|nr:hypothetical protein [Datura stramonium]
MTLVKIYNWTRKRSIKPSYLPPELRGQRDAVRSKMILSMLLNNEYGIHVVEGQFENLPGKGKPLDLNTNPHADPAEDTLYRILSRSNVCTWWVELNKEIRNRVIEWRSTLKKAWTHRGSANDSQWIEASESLKLQMRDINNKVFRYNLIVPFGRQMFGLKWEKSG